MNELFSAITSFALLYTKNNFFYVKDTKPKIINIIIVD